MVGKIKETRWVTLFIHQTRGFSIFESWNLLEHPVLMLHSCCFFRDERVKYSRTVDHTDVNQEGFVTRTLAAILS